MVSNGPLSRQEQVKQALLWTVDWSANYRAVSATEGLSPPGGRNRFWWGGGRIMALIIIRINCYDRATLNYKHTVN